MGYENVRLRKPNVIMVNGYFYMMDESADSLIVKTDDGTQAFTYPLDTTITNEVVSIEYDGYNFWTLENLAGDNITIRKWYLYNHICRLRNTFQFVESGAHKYDSNAFTVEHYHITFSSDEEPGETVLNITGSGKDKLTSGLTIVLGPSTATGYVGKMEELTVQSATDTTVVVNTPTTVKYKLGDPICFYNRIWFFNNYNGIDGNEGALYKISPGGAYQYKYPSGEYQNVSSCTFYDMYDLDNRPTWGNSICYVKTTNMLCLDPDTLMTFGSLTMDNINSNQADVYAIYDLTIEGSNIYRLQTQATYYGADYVFIAGPYNYQLSTMNPLITSIALRADPAIVPANGVSESNVVATVKDQFGSPISSKLVYFTDDDPDGAILYSPVNTNEYGVATTTYRAGTTAREVRITSSAEQS